MANNDVPMNVDGGAERAERVLTPEERIAELEARNAILVLEAAQTASEKYKAKKCQELVKFEKFLKLQGKLMRGCIKAIRECEECRPKMDDYQRRENIIKNNGIEAAKIRTELTRRDVEIQSDENND